MLKQQLYKAINQYGVTVLEGLPLKPLKDVIGSDSNITIIEM